MPIAGRAGGLLHRLFTLADLIVDFRLRIEHYSNQQSEIENQQYISVALSGKLPRPGRYPAPCSVECGLSSESSLLDDQRSPGQPEGFHDTRFVGKSQL